jgi:hypothetical protein
MKSWRDRSALSTNAQPQGAQLPPVRNRSVRRRRHDLNDQLQLGRGGGSLRLGQHAFLNPMLPSAVRSGRRSGRVGASTQRRATLANIIDRVICSPGGVWHEECNASKWTAHYSLHWTLEGEGAQVVSAEMTMRLVFLGVIAALLLIGFGMGKDGYRAPRRRRQPAAPEADTSLVTTGSSAASDVAWAAARTDDTIAVGR